MSWQWKTGHPLRNGEYLIVRRIWRDRVTAHWFNGIGWMIGNIRLGEDGAEAWDNLPELPDDPTGGWGEASFGHGRQPMAERKPKR